MRKLKELYAQTLVGEFGPKDLVAVRTAMVGEGVSRKIVNSRVQVMKKVFRWGVAEDLVPPLVHTKLTAVEGVRAGRTTAPDHPPVRPAVAADVEAAIPHMPPAVAAIVKLQRMTGARCGELCSLRTVDIDRTNPAMWTFAPAGHKGTWRGKSRTIYFGKRCQELLGSFLSKVSDPTWFVFSPIQSEEERIAIRSAKRRTPRWARHMNRNMRKRIGKARKRPPRDRYFTQSVRQAIERACEKAGVPVFTPHQLPHLAATEIRAEFGIDVARAVLGHTMAAMSEHYSKEVDKALAAKAVEKFG